jgi:hypothetical protein
MMQWQFNTGTNGYLIVRALHKKTQTIPANSWNPERKREEKKVFQGQNLPIPNEE